MILAALIIASFALEDGKKKTDKDEQKDEKSEELKNEETQEEPQKIKEKEEGREVSDVTSSNEYEEKRS